MTTIQTILQAQHVACDDAFALAETAAERADWPACADAFQRFHAAMTAHFAIEEDVLFPAFEAATGMSGGPTVVMRSEHRQMEGLLAELQAAVAARDGEAYAGAAQTLLVLLQQHNFKEENILYPMCDQHLHARLSDLLPVLAQGEPA